MLMDARKGETSRKQRITHELVTYGINATYLAMVFSLFAWYRRLILAEYNIPYLKYGVAIVEGLVLAKVVWAGDLLGLRRKFFRNKPLIYPTLSNSAAFSFVVGVFAVTGHTVGGSLQGKS